ncbi:MAG TPA: CinA family protein [Gammaproteobacteria bacterium]|nr:CinA family protein [Gammaproteobacteria bacterium]
MSAAEQDLEALALRVARALLVRRWRLGVAESCTGGWIAKTLTDVAGSSDWFNGGIVSYSNAAKTELLGVGPELLAVHGAVSEPVVRAMAKGACERFHTQLAVAVSGIAGPDGGTPDKPVGTVWFAWATPAGTGAARRVFVGGREAVRRQSVAFALERLVDMVWRDERTG